MVGANRSLWAALERWSPRLYLVAGSILAVYALFNGLNAFAGTTVDPKVFEAGYIAGFLGLLGLARSASRRTQWLGRAGALAALLGLCAFTVFTASNVAKLAGLAAGNPPGWSIFTVMAASGFVVGYLCVGTAVLRSGSFPRPVGLLLLLPGVIIVLMFVTIVTGVASDGSVFVVSAGQAMTHLALGATLEADVEAREQDPPESTADATASG